MGPIRSISVEIALGRGSTSVKSPPLILIKESTAMTEKWDILCMRFLLSPFMGGQVGMTGEIGTSYEIPFFKGMTNET